MSYLDILNQYAELLITQYRNKTKANAEIKLLINSSVCDGLPTSLRDTFDLSSAYGNQLTIIGKIVGIPRNVLGLDLQHIFFTYTKYNGGSPPASIGFIKYDSASTSELILRYQQDANYTLSDIEMSVLIKLKIISNTRFLTYKNVEDGLYLYFGSDIYITKSASVMQIDYHVATKYRNAFTAALFIDAVPRPMGVSINATYF